MQQKRAKGVEGFLIRFVWHQVKLISCTKGSLELLFSEC